jgi:hypothetical protein
LERKKGLGTDCAQHPQGRSDNRYLPPFSEAANKNKTTETIGGQDTGFGFSVEAGGYD